jgi:hypothetical protein
MPNPNKAEALAALKALTGAARAAYSISEFCAMVDISVSMYGKLRREGLTPREMRLGRRVLISSEALAQWRTEREAAAS